MSRDEMLNFFYKENIKDFMNSKTISLSIKGIKKIISPKLNPSSIFAYNLSGIFENYLHKTIFEHLMVKQLNLYITETF